GRAGVVELEVLVAVEGEDGDAVALVHAQLAPQGVGHTQDAVAVLLPCPVVVAVVEPDPRREAVEGREQLPVVDELLHVGDVRPARNPSTRSMTASASSTNR